MPSLAVPATVRAKSAARPQIEVDAPLIVAFAEVETVTVDRPAPLFGCEPAMIVHNDPGALSKPRMKLGVRGLLGGGDLLAFWRSPERLNAVAPLVECAAAIFGCACAHADRPQMTREAAGIAAGQSAAR
ncbi:hypothetical protein AWC31_17860 [Mycolicibacterium wolinskyi]|uniref:Uncharacterized protein n=1 Tax=Mycolicibacterium wolinskyi TaxID=59750 RepID=A0A1X2FFG7_9MYCO|nr:hypothetical protein AWC31_17860 [Mycolicibacterium wolinskyi]